MRVTCLHYQHPPWKLRTLLIHSPQYPSQRVSDLPQHDAAILSAPICDDIKHARTVAPNDPVVHLCILCNVGIHGPDHSHRRPQLDGLGHGEVVES